MANGWRGLALPIHFENGQLAMSSAIPSEDIFDKIDESIESIVTANEYENPMTGIGVPNLLVFKQFDSELVPYYQTMIKERINTYEPRVHCSDVFVATEPDEDGYRIVEINYYLLASNIPRLLTIYTETN